MRLICPNCAAQYEVPDEVIPPAGRDVQCSSCGTTWFQGHPGSAETPPTPAETAPAPEPEPEAEPAPEPEAEAEAEPIPEPAIAAASAPAEPAAEAAADPSRDTGAADIAGHDAPRSPRRKLDPTVAELLREEARHEAEVRAAEAATGLESQPDLGLDDHGPGTAPMSVPPVVPPAGAAPDSDAPEAEIPDEATRRARESQARMARLRGLTPEDEGAAAGPRRDLLPDIEEINSTLRSSSERRDEDQAAEAQDAAEPRRRGAFRSGFLLVVAVTFLLVVTYVAAPAISRSAPQVAPAMAAYVERVDVARGWVNARLGDALVWLDSQASEAETTATAGD